MTSPERGHRVLVTSASRYGTTTEIAEAIAATLREQGLAAVAVSIEDVTDLADHDSVVIGAAINYDNWMSEAREFVTDNEAVLATMPVAYFFTCGTLFESTEASRAKAQRYADRIEGLSDRISPIAIGQFAGVLDWGRMSLRARILWRIPFAFLGAREGDHRDWGAIRAWTLGLPLLPPAHPLPMR